MLGQGPTLRRALQELNALPPGDLAFAITTIFHKWWTTMAHSPNTIDPEIIEMADKLVEKWKHEAIEFGRNEGRSEGRSEGLAPLTRQFGRRLRRPLTEPERATLSQRLTTLGPDRLGDVILDITEADALETWLHDPDAR